MAAVAAPTSPDARPSIFANGWGLPTDTVGSASGPVVLNDKGAGKGGQLGELGIVSPANCELLDGLQLIVDEAGSASVASDCECMCISISCYILNVSYTAIDLRSAYSPRCIHAWIRWLVVDIVQRVMCEAWRKHGADIAGADGYHAVRLQAARDSHPEFPIFASCLASMASLGNGHPPTHASVSRH